MPVKSRFRVYVRGVAVFMLFAMFHYMVGYRLVYSLGILFAKEQAKEQMAEKKNMKELMLTMPDYNALKWTEKSKEFCFHNEMYDVTSMQKSADGYVMKVYCDNAETGWVASFHNYEKELFHPDQSAKGTKSAEDIMSSFQKEYTPSSEFKILVFTYGTVIHHAPAAQQHSLMLPDAIWHPPYSC